MFEQVNGNSVLCDAPDDVCITCDCGDGTGRDCNFCDHSND